GDTYSLNDVVYYDDPAGTGVGVNFVTIGDVVLSGSDMGHVSAASDAQTTYVLNVGGGLPAGFCYVDTDGSGTFNTDEPVYFAANFATCGGVGGVIATADVRIANPSVGTKGSQVKGTDNDVGH